MNRRTFLKKTTAGMLAAGLASGIPVKNGYAQGKTFRWRMVTSWPPGFPILQTGVERFVTRVAQLSGGRLQIRVFAGGELVPPLGVFDAVSQGSAQMGHSASYYWAGKCPAAQWFTSVPFGFNAQGMNSWLYYGGGLRLWEEIYRDFNLVPRPAGNTGVQMGGWFNKRIDSLKDFKGLKMRIPGLGGKVLARAGGTVVLLPGGEIYTSLERGVIDATEWVGPCHDLRMGFQRVAKFYYGPGWHEPGSTLELTINKDAYDGLPVDLRAVIDTAAAELNVQMLSEFETENARALERLRSKSKVKILTFPTPVLEGLKKLSVATLEDEAARDSQATKVHRSYLAFKRVMEGWSELSEKQYYNVMLG